MSDSRRIRGHLTWDWVDRRLRSGREIWVATAGTAAPDAIPVWFWWDGADVYFTTKAASRKARNARRIPDVVLHNGDGADPIILKGDAEVVSARDELERLDDVAVARERGAAGLAAGDDDDLGARVERRPRRPESPLQLALRRRVERDAAELERVDRAYAEKYVDPHSGARATIFVEGDVVFRVRPRLVMAWEYATCSTRTDWVFA